MNYSNKYIDEINKDKLFVKSNLEKVVRLLDVLTFISEELNSQENKLVLKGGTAINLVYNNLARLSVDIDLDYVGSLDKEKTEQDRVIIMDALDNYMIGEDYIVSSKSRGSAILVSRTYSYTNAFGNKDNIKVEINFIDRVHIDHSIRKAIKCFDKEVVINTLGKEELFGMKICALVDRAKPRDLFDIYMMGKRLSNMDVLLLRKMTVFYMSLDNIFEINMNTFDRIKMISQEDIKKELLPVLSRNNRFDLIQAKESVISFLEELLTLTNEEKEYLIEFAKGNYNPSLLFEGLYADNALKHPMAKWIIVNLKK